MRTATRDDRAHALLSEASQCLAHDKTSKAKRLCEKAVAMAPGSADAHMILADVLAKRSETDLARKHYEKATNCERYHFGAWLNYGVFLKELGEFKDAILAFKNAVLIDPKSSLARYNLARALLNSRQNEEALEAFQIFTKMEPNFAEGYHNLAVAQDRLRKTDAAIESCKTALKLDPEFARAHLQMGTLLFAQGKFDEGEDFLKKGLELNPLSARSYAALAISNRIGNENEEHEVLTHIKTEIDRDDISPQGRSQFLTVAFTILERNGEYDEAFECLKQSNDIRNTAIGDRFDETPERWRRMKDQFSKEDLADWSLAGNSTDQLIFIVGMPRSGTTLTEQILASHPRVYGAGELLMVNNATDKTLRALGGSPSYPEFVKDLTEEQFLELAENCLSELPEEATAYDKVTDKLPFNFVDLGLLSVLFPNAKFVHCRRNAIDTCLSCYVQNFSHDIWFSFDLEKLAYVYRLHVELMDHWRDALPGRIHEVRYEKLTADPEPHIRTLLEFCDLEWDDACMSFHATERNVKTASVWQVRQPMYKTSVEKWKRYEKHLGPLIEGLGDLAHS